MRTITTSKGVTIELDGDLQPVLEALFKTCWDNPDDYSYEHTVREVQHVLGQLSDAEARQYLAEALTLCYTTYENGRLERVMKKLGTTEALTRRSMSLNYQAERFTCSWPWSTAILLCDGRDLVRLLRPVRQARARRHPASSAWRRCGADRRPRELREDINTGGSGFCGDCPLEAAAGRRRGGAGARPERRAAAQPALRRVHRRLQHLVLPGLLRARDRHHPDPPGRHARLRPVHPGDRRGRPDARPGRLLQLRRGVPAQARRRDVRVHQDEVPAHLPLHQHQRPGAQRGEGPAAGPLGHRRGDLLDRRRLAGHLRALPAARQVRPGDRQPARDGRREGPARPRRAADQLALHPLQLERLGRGDGEGAAARRRARRRSAVWEITDHPEDSFSRRFAPGTADFDRIKYEVWDHSGLGNAIPGATPRAEIDVPALARRRAAGRPPRRDRSPSRPTCATSPTRPFRKQASYGRRLVRLGAQLVGADGALSTATTRGPGCRATSRPAAAPMSPSTCRCPRRRAATR